MKVCTADQIREVDRLAIEGHGLPSVVLMETAGRAVVEVIARELGGNEALDGVNVAVLTGSGNNAGDGFVVARHLIGRGANVVTLLLSDPARLKGDARINYDVLVKMGADMRQLRASDILRESHVVAEARVVVDALFGTGLARDVGGHYREAIELCNHGPIRSDALRIAVDIPSGLCADSGRVLGVAFAADHTVTFGYPKIGMVNHPGFEHVGELHVADIGVPATVEGQAAFAAELLEERAVRRRLLVRPPWGHKGTYGHLLIIAGSPGKSGAAALAAEAALRSGVGLCTIAAPASVVESLEHKTRESMLAALLPDGTTLDDDDKLFERIAKLATGKDAIAVGPGLLRDPTSDDNSASARFMARLVRESKVPLVIDADGLNDLSGQVEVLGEASVPVLLTPHPGEMARLIGGSVADVQADRYGVATSFAREHGVYVALKGARTVIAEPGGNAYINPTGNSGMGSGGTGDALTGIVGGFLAQRHPPADALVVGVYAHGAAGDQAAQRVGQRALLASDLIDALPAVLRNWD